MALGFEDLPTEDRVEKRAPHLRQPVPMMLAGIEESKSCWVIPMGAIALAGRAPSGWRRRQASIGRQ